MADVQSNIEVNLDASQALGQLKALQRQLANFHASVATTSSAAAKAQASLQTNLINSVNATGKFAAGLTTITSSADSFTDSLERNKFSTREYFRYAGGATKTFSRLFKQEYDTIGKVSEERLKTMQTQYIKMGRTANGAIQSIAIRPLALDMDHLATKTALAAQKQQLFGQLLKQGSTNLLNFGKNTQWAGRQLMVGFTVPLTMLGSTAGKTFMELEKQAVRFKRVYGEMFTTSGETEKAFKEIELLAKSFTKYGVAVEKTMEMAADAAASGKMGAELMAQVAEATRLAVLGGVEQADALATTISLTNAFGIEADKLKNKIDFLNAVENQTVLNIEDLTIAVPKAGPVIRQLGGDVEDLAFFMTAMKEGGINASEGANALKSGLASLINPSKKASAFLLDLGVNINGIVESNKGNIKDTVIQFAQALDTLAPLERSRAIEQLFGKFQFSRLSTLFQNVTQSGTQASKTLGLAGASIEELAILSERELAKVENATGTKFKKSLENLKVSLAPVGEQFLKAITPIVEFIGKILEKFNGLGEGSKKAIVMLIGAVGLVGPALLMTFGLIANGAANIIKLFLTLRNGFLGLGKQSNFLGNQTRYMSSEQIEAATIATSLNQSHSRLIQTFTAETAAATALAAAYQKANVAGINFARINPGMMKGGLGPKKFASGGWVPGTGNKDTVPAVLTPGEFVVRKDAAQENKGFLQRLNKGGFVLRNDGTPTFKNIQDPWAGEVKGGPKYDPTLPKFVPGSIEYAKAFVAQQAEEAESERRRIEFEKDIRKNQSKRPTKKPTPVNRDWVAWAADQDAREAAAKVAKHAKKVAEKEAYRAKKYKQKEILRQFRPGITEREIGYAKTLAAKTQDQMALKTQSLFLGLPNSNKQVQDIRKQDAVLDLINNEVRSSNLDKIRPTNFGKIVAESTGKSFPVPGIGGIYERPDGSKVFVKPFLDEKSAVAEMRGTTIARDVHGLVSPEQKLATMIDPNNPGRKLIVLQSPFDPKFAEMTGEFTKSDFVKQAVASVIRGDKDLSKSNVSGNRLPDVGTAGVFATASAKLPGERQFGGLLPVKDQALVNFLGVSGGAKRYFADATRPIAQSMTPAQYEKAMLAELDRVLPKLKSTIAGFGTLNPEEKVAYAAMVQRVEDAKKIDWKEIHKVHIEAKVPKIKKPKIKPTEQKGERGHRVSIKDPAFRKLLVARGFKTKFDGTATRAGEGLGAEMLHTSTGNPKHYHSATNPPRPLLANLKQNAGRTVLLNHPFNQLSETIRQGKGRHPLTGMLPETYPYNLEEAKQSAKIIQNEIKRRRDLEVLRPPVPTDKIRQSNINFIKNSGNAVLIEALADLKSQIKLNPTSSMYKSTMATRYALSGAIAEGQDHTGPVFKKLYKVFMDTSMLSSKNQNKAMNRIVDALYAKGWTDPDTNIEHKLADAGQGSRGENTPGKGAGRSRGAQRKVILTKDYGRFGQGVDPEKILSRSTMAKAFSMYPDMTPEQQHAMRGLIPRPDDVKYMPPELVPQTTKLLNFFKFMTKSKFRGYKFASGGSVPGYGEKDTVPALLTPGEFVVNKKATQENGPILEAMNSGKVEYRGDGTRSIFDDPEPQRYYPNPYNEIGQPGERTTAGGIVLPKGVDDPFADVGKEFEKQTKKSVNSLGTSVGGSIQGLGERLSEKFKIIANKPMRPSTDKELDDFAKKLDAEAANQSTRRFGRKPRVTPDAQTLAAQQARSQKMMQRSSMAMSGVMMGNMALGMMGNETAQKYQGALGALTAATMAMTMIQGPKSAIAVGLAGLAATYIVLKKQNEALLKKTIETTVNMGAGAKSMKELAETTGKVSAREIMDRRRNEKLSQFQIKTGKKTFGESFVEGEKGQQMVKDFGQRIKDGGPGGQQLAQSELTAQLATAISSGIMTPQQARSVAANIGEAMGDRALGITVNAKLIDLFGPKGENLLKDPLTIKTQLIQDSKTRMNVAANAANASGTFKGNRDMAYGAGGGIAGGLAGAGAGYAVGMGAAVATAAATGSAVGTVVPIVGTAIGALVGIGIGAMVGLKQRNDRIAKATGASVAMQKIALEQGQELLDSYDLENQKKIQLLESEGKLVEAEKLRGEYQDGRAKLLAQNASLNTDILNSYKKASGGKVQDLLLKGARNAAIDKYKGTALAPVAEEASKQIQGLGLNKEQEYLINMQLSSGQMDPMQVLNMVDMFTGDKEGAQKFMDITTRFGAVVANEAMAVASMFTEKGTGKDLDKIQKDLVLSIKGKTPEEAQKLIDFYGTLGKMGTVLDMEVVGNYVEKNKIGAAALRTTIEQIQKQKGKMTMKVTTELLGANSKALSALNTDLAYYNSLPDEQKKIYLTALVTTTETIDVNSQDFKNFMNEKALTTDKNKARTLTADAKDRKFDPKGYKRTIKLVSQKQAEDMYKTNKAQKITAASIEASKAFKPGGKGGGTGQRDTTYDDTLKKLKLVQNSTINAIGGAEELKKVMGKNASLTQFQGIDQKLMANGQVSRDFLDFVDAMSPQGLQEDLADIATGAGTASMKLTTLGNALNKAFTAIKLGEYQTQLTDRLSAIKNQVGAMSVLRGAGFSYAEAMELASDQTLALAIANKELSPEQLKELKNQTKELTRAQKEYETVTKIALMDEMDGQVARFNVVEKFVALQEKLIENQYVLEQSKLETKQNDNNYNLDLISRQEDKINEIYDKQISALEEINNLTERANELQSRKLDIASAFASGDMGAAASAMQEYRNAKIAQNAKTRMDALQKAKTNAIASVTSPNGLTRTQIEADNKIIADRLSDITNTIRLEKDKLDLTLKDTLGLTRVEIAAAGSAIKLALEAGINPNDSKFLGNILKGVKGDADSTITALTNVTASIKAADAAMKAAKAEVGTKGNKEFADTEAENELKAKAAAAAKAAALAAGGGTPPVSTPSSGSSPGYVAIGSNFYPVDNNLKPKSAPNADWATQMGRYLGGVGPMPDMSSKPKTTPKKTEEPSYQDRLRQLGILFKSGGGLIPKYMNMGGVVPKYFAAGGYGKGTDTIPAMLTPGEFVVNKKATQEFGPLLSAINSPTFKTPEAMSSIKNLSGSQTEINNSKTLYNYNLSVNVSNSNANPNDIARTVINQIKQIDNQRIRSL